MSELKNNRERIDAITDVIGGEVERAMSLHAPQHSHHEAYAVILEELDEYWEQVKRWPKRHDPVEMRTELIHVAAMAVRAIIDLKL